MDLNNKKPNLERYYIRKESKVHIGVVDNDYWDSVSFETKDHDDLETNVQEDLSGELTVEWVDQGLFGSWPVPYFQIFIGYMDLFKLFDDLFQSLVEVDLIYMKEDEFCTILDSLGFIYEKNEDS